MPLVPAADMAGSTTLPSFTGSQQRTSRGQQLMLAFLHIAAAAWVFTWMRRYNTYPDKIKHYTHYTMQTYHFATRHHATTPWRGAERERQLETIGLTNHLPTHQCNVVTRIPVITHSRTQSIFTNRFRTITYAGSAS